MEFAAYRIALSNDGKQLYWQAIKGKTLYRIATSSIVPGLTNAVLPTELADMSIARKIETVGDNGPADGLWIAGDGTMYVSSPQDDSIKSRNLGSDDVLKLVLQDSRLRWPDTFSEGSDGTIYITTSHIQDSAFYKPDAPIVELHASATRIKDKLSPDNSQLTLRKECRISQTNPDLFHFKFQPRTASCLTSPFTPDA